MNTYLALLTNKPGLILLVCIFIGPLAWAKTPSVEIRIRNHLFYPSSLSIPANTKVKLLIINEDDTSEEFESYQLNREKVIAGKQKVIVFIGPLRPGKYPFWGEFHPHTALGNVLVE